MSLSVLWVPHETSAMARKRHSYPTTATSSPRRCRERHVRDMGGVANVPFTSLNVLNVPFTTSALSRTCRSQHPADHCLAASRTKRMTDGKLTGGSRFTVSKGSFRALAGVELRLLHEPAVSGGQYARVEPGPGTQLVEQLGDA